MKTEVEVQFPFLLKNCGHWPAKVILIISNNNSNDKHINSNN